MVRSLIPDLEGRMGQFEVETFEMDEELLDAFSEELTRLTDELEAGLKADDEEAVKVAAHSIKGMGGTIGLPEISVLAQEIEMMARAGDAVRTKTLSTELIDWARRLKAAS